MPKKTRKGLLASSNSLKILTYLSAHPGQEFLNSEIQRATGVSRAGAYLALRELLGHGIATKIEKGRFHLYAVNHDDPVIRQYKVLTNVIALEHLIKKIKPFALAVVLFGSAARGEDYASSDIDIFVRTFVPEKIRSLLASYKGERRIQSIVLEPSEWSDFKEREPIFFEEIERGITLWEKKDESGFQRMPQERENQRIHQRKKSRP
jgi:predicted nucleotidyltransferase